VDTPLLRPNLVVADVRMPNLSGLGVLAALQRARWGVPVLLITALRDESVQTVARRMGAIGVLRKPFETDDLLTAVMNAGALFERSRSSRPPPVSGSGADGQPVGAARAAPKPPSDPR
jgi:FixJ family two-component response regulator